MAVSINNREDVNKYYQQINLLVDDYIEKWKIRPKNLKSYLKPGSERFAKFLKRNNLDIEGANIILNDVINDRVSMESDGVFTFENFKYFESSEFKINSLKECLYKGIERSTIEQEKVIADYFDLNLGDIEIIDSYKHKYKISDWQNDDWNVVIYSDEEVDLIKQNIFDHLFSEISTKEVELIPNLNVKLDNIIKEEDFIQKMNDLITETKFRELVASCLGTDWSFQSTTRSHSVWVS